MKSNKRLDQGGRGSHKRYTTFAQFEAVSNNVWTKELNERLVNSMAQCLRKHFWFCFFSTLYSGSVLKVAIFLPFLFCFCSLTPIFHAINWTLRNLKHSFNLSTLNFKVYTARWYGQLNVDSKWRFTTRCDLYIVINVYIPCHSVNQHYSLYIKK